MCKCLGPSTLGGLMNQSEPRVCTESLEYNSSHMLPGAAGFPGDSSPFSGVDTGIVIFQKVNNSW